MSWLQRQKATLRSLAARICRQQPQRWKPQEKFWWLTLTFLELIASYSPWKKGCIKKPLRENKEKQSPINQTCLSTQFNSWNIYTQKYERYWKVVVNDLITQLFQMISLDSWGVPEVPTVLHFVLEIWTKHRFAIPSAAPMGFNTTHPHMKMTPLSHHWLSWHLESIWSNKIQ